MKKTILLFSTLSPYPFWAGSETYWYDLVLDPRTRERFDFRIRLAESPETHKKAKSLAAAGAEVFFFDHYNINFLRRNFGRLRDRIASRPFRRLPWYDVILKGDCDLVWFNVDGLHNLGELEYAAGLCEQADVPYWILLQHGYEDFFIDGEHQLAAYCRIATGAKRFVFIAERNRRALERAIGQCLNNAYRSHNSLAAERFKTAIEHLAQRPPGSGEEAEFFNLGRFAPKDKGQHLILEALSSEAWRGRNWRISFVGVSGFGAEYLERMAAYFGLAQDRIRFVPFTDNVFAEIASRDVLLMPSLAEGTPYAMIESMACGRPAVGTPIGGIPELIQDGITGWLARTTNVADIADAMERMWDSRDKWVAIGQSARRLVEVQNNETFVYADILDALEADTKR